MVGITLQEMSDDTVQQLYANYVRQPAFAHTEGIASAYSVTLNPEPTSLADGFGITIVPHVTNEAEVTLNINELGAIVLKDQKGKSFTAGKLQAGKPYTFRKVGADFLADSSGGSGDAIAGDIRAGKVATTDDGEIVGTMPTHSDVFKAGNYFNDLHNTFLDSEVAIDTGYYPENTKVRIQINDSNFKSENIKSGVTIFGEEGSYIGAGNATAGDIRAGKTATTDDGEVAGELPVRTGGTVVPSTTTQIKQAGIYDSDIHIQGDSNLISKNIIKGTSIFDVNGSTEALPPIIPIERVEGVSFLNGKRITSNYGYNICFDNEDNIYFSYGKLISEDKTGTIRWTNEELLDHPVYSQKNNDLVCFYNRKLANNSYEYAVAVINKDNGKVISYFKIDVYPSKIDIDDLGYVYVLASDGLKKYQYRTGKLVFHISYYSRDWNSFIVDRSTGYVFLSSNYNGTNGISCFDSNGSLLWLKSGSSSGLAIGKFNNNKVIYSREGVTKIINLTTGVHIGTITSPSDYSVYGPSNNYNNIIADNSGRLFTLLFKETGDYPRCFIEARDVNRGINRISEQSTGGLSQASRQEIFGPKDSEGIKNIIWNDHGLSFWMSTTLKIL